MPDTVSPRSRVFGNHLGADGCPLFERKGNMKRITLALVGLLFAAVSVHAAAAADGVTDANYTYVLDTTISSNSTAIDSIIGHATTIDSVVVLDDWSPKWPGWEYILVRDSLVTAADSCTLAVVINCLDANGTKIYEYHADTVKGLRAGEAVDLSIGGGALGNKYDVMFKSIAATDRGSQIKLIRCYLWRRKAVTHSARWSH